MKLSIITALLIFLMGFNFTANASTLLVCDSGLPDGGSGVWNYKSYDLDLDDGCETISINEFNSGKIFLRITGNQIRYYRCGGNKCYYCPEHDTDAIDFKGFAISDNILTVYYEDYDGDDCIPKMVLEKASESDIDGAIEDCDYDY